MPAIISAILCWTPVKNISLVRNVLRKIQLVEFLVHYVTYLAGIGLLRDQCRTNNVCIWWLVRLLFSGERICISLFFMIGLMWWRLHNERKFANENEKKKRRNCFNSSNRSSVMSINLTYQWKKSSALCTLMRLSFLNDPFFKKFSFRWRKAEEREIYCSRMLTKKKNL